MKLPALIGIGAGALLLFLRGKKSALVKAGEQLIPSVSNFELHKVDMTAKKLFVNLKLNFLNPTDTTIKVSNLIVRINLPVQGKWLALAVSRSTGAFDIVPGSTSKDLRISAPLVVELTNILPTFFAGTTQQIQVQAFAEVFGKKLDPVEQVITIDPRMITTSLLKDHLGLGFIDPSFQKKVKPYTTTYEKHFHTRQLEGSDPFLSSGDTFKTLDHMRDIVLKTLSDTVGISKALKKQTVPKTIESVFTFMNDSFNYRLDDPSAEQMRRPLRAWKDRMHGIDCDCMVIFMSSVFTNLGISHTFRKAKYDGKGYSHIYLMAHHHGLDFILDPVYGKWNQEHPYTSKFDQKQL